MLAKFSQPPATCLTGGPPDGQTVQGVHGRESARSIDALSRHILGPVPRISWTTPLHSSGAPAPLSSFATLLPLGFVSLDSASG